ncbi:MAG TPA: tetratricopeptide repeat protein [Pirellulales bacterium]|nr:tetratricopeptide repeat protein [Pirellulales bacterium]
MLKPVCERHSGLATVGLAYALLCIGLASPSAAQQPVIGRTLYAGPRGTTVVAPPPGPGSLDPLSVSAYWGFWPSPILARQPIGHQTIATSPNGYVYRPVYPGDPSIALPNATEAAAASPSFLARYAAGPASAEALFDAALVLFKAGRYEAAVDRLNRVLDQKPDHGDAWLLLVQAYFGLANYEAAADTLSGALASAPEYNWDKFTRDYRKYFASPLRFAVHLRTLERFVEQHPERREGHLLLGYQYGSLGKTDVALRELSSAQPNPEADKLSRRFGAADEAPAPAPDDDLEAAGPPRAVNPPAGKPPAPKRRGREF